MNWDAIGAIGEVLGAVGVILTLAYVAVQIRHSRKQVEHNTRAIELESARSITEQLMSMFALITSDQSLANIVESAAAGETLSNAHKMRYYTFMGNLFRAYENAYLFRQREVLDDEHWQGITRMMIDITKLRLFDAYWADRKHWFEEEFQHYVEAEVISKPLPDGVSIPGEYVSD